MPFKKGETPKGAKPFKKGHSGNPKGRPKQIPDLKEVLNEVLGDEKDGITAMTAILVLIFVLFGFVFKNKKKNNETNI